MGLLTIKDYNHLIKKHHIHPYETNVEKACQEELLLITETDFKIY